MAASWRIKAFEVNSSQIAIPTVGNVGATVIRAPYGPTKPVKIYSGGEQRILSIFGTPNSNYPDIWDAIEYNKEADIWISAPSKNGKYGGVLVTPSGTIDLLDGFDSTAVDFTALPFSESLGTGDGSTTSFSMTLDDVSHYNNQSIDILVNGVSINVDATDAATEVLSTTPNVGSGTYVRTTGVLTFTFTSAPASGSVIKAYYTVDRSSDAYFVLTSKNPEANRFASKITASSSTGLFTINLYSKSGTAYTEFVDSPLTASLVENTKDGFGKNIYIEDLFTDSDSFAVYVNSNTFSSFVNDTTYHDFVGGSRGDAITITELTLGWNYFQQTNTYQSDILFDCTADPGIPAIFETLRNTYQKYSAYLLPLPNQASTTAITTKNGYSISNRGIYFYWNWGKVKDTYNNSYFYSALMGRVAKKHAQMVDIYNGLAPSWIDENNHGGQLGSGIISMVYEPTESELETLDENQINPIIFDNQYGVMIVGDRTSLTTLSDYSYIGHSRTADYCISNIIKQALPYQITKLNDLTHRNIVRTKAGAIVNPLLAPSISLLSEAAVKCDSENNDASVLARRAFVLTVGVKFTPFSERIEFTFQNVGQNVSVSETIGA